MNMIECRGKAELRAALSEWRESEPVPGRAARVALVPTMGYLHEGHLELIRAGKRQADRVAVSIFVNPLQFNDPEDFQKYPVNTPRDLQLCREAGADLVFLPTVTEMYPGYANADAGGHTGAAASSAATSGRPLLRLTMPELTRNLCGQFRPGHFDGVLMVVARLFNLVRPDVALFGKKDYQQYLVIKRLSMDLDFGVEVVGVDTVREADGLALSSRNARLSGRGREHAALIHRALRIGEKAQREGAADAAELKEIVRDVIESGSLNKVEYMEILDPESLRELDRVLPGRRYLMATAVFCEGVRLIDNIECGSLEIDKGEI
jgi:pantoate--beta-alanine ligase